MNIWLPTIRANTGADSYVKNLANGLRRRGISVILTWYPHLLELIPHLMSWSRIPDGVDVIHANSPYAFAFSAKGLPLVTTVYHWVHVSHALPRRGLARTLYHDILIRRYEERSIATADCVTAISAYTAQQVAAHLPRAEPQIIYPGLDTAVFRPSGNPPAQREIFRLLHVGTPSRRKGFDLLRPVMEKLGKGFELRYTQGPAFRGQANMYRLGRLDLEMLVREYQCCDALLFPTYYEGFGYVAAEAMACGKPVITSNCSALPELVENGKTGILCAPGDIDAFVEAARRLRSAPGLTQLMGRTARARIESAFTLDRMIDRYVDLYRSLN